MATSQRVYDISTTAMLVAIGLAVVAWLLAVFAPNLHFSSSETAGAWLLAVMATRLAIYAVHGWIYGQKTAAPAHISVLSDRFR